MKHSYMLILTVLHLRFVIITEHFLIAEVETHGVACNSDTKKFGFRVTRDTSYCNCMLHLKEAKLNAYCKLIWFA